MSSQTYQLKFVAAEHPQPIEARLARLIITARQVLSLDTAEVVVVLTDQPSTIPPANRLRRLLKIAGRREHLRCVDASDKRESIAERPEPRRKPAKRASVAVTRTRKAVA